MSYTATYLNFPGNTEEAFNFYRSVFGGEFEGGIFRFGGVPAGDEMSKISEEDKNLVMHICLPLLGGHRLMGTDAVESMGMNLVKGNNTYISLHPDTREEADRLFGSLSENGEIEQAMKDEFWGAYFGSFTDQFGIQWMINCEQS